MSGRWILKHNRYHCRFIECVNLQRQKQKFLELQMFFDFSATVPNEVCYVTHLNS